MNIETANRLLQYRKKSGYSQEELAEKIGVSRQAVSKWERAEAAPDTDNLILLAHLYNVSLDELLTGKSHISENEKANSENNCSENEESEEQQSDDDLNGPKSEYSDASDAKDTVSFKNGIHVESQNGDKVHIGFGGIHVHDKNGTKVDIDSNGIFVNDLPRNDIGTDGNGHIVHGDSPKSIWYKFPYPILALAVFTVWGLWGGWYISWIVFLTIPLYYSLVDAIVKRKPHHFAYPVLTAVIYLFAGINCNLWHPGWIIFLTIPIYYFICEFCREIYRHNKSKNTED